jgi:magnesium transporter
MNENSPMIDALKETIGKIQVQAQQGKLRNIQLAEEFPDITNALTNLDRLVTGQSRVFTTLAKRLLGEAVINERTAKRFEHLEQESRDLKEDLKTQRALIDTSISTSRLYVSWIDTSIARKIAALQAVCLPIIATSGFWGQNFTSLPTGSAWFFWGTIGFNVLATSVLLSQAVKEKWFSK